MQMDRRTNMTNVRVACRTLADALQNEDIAEFVFLHFDSPVKERMCSGGCFSTEVEPLRSHLLLYSDTSANEDNSFRNHIR